ncbi:hypothetical protein UY3_07663 [Chelonia mydas]|uniref:Uncharacterized protein n=1 Tax=Chelonia mydas TaxID=8469 RepID=M7BSV1_CHEMY|nr:hypothetical protein UY3_07663 [Chelonia mydas]
MEPVQVGERKQQASWEVGRPPNSESEIVLLGQSPGCSVLPIPPGRGDLAPLRKLLMTPAGLLLPATERSTLLFGQMVPGPLPLSPRAQASRSPPVIGVRPPA